MAQIDIFRSPECGITKVNHGRLAASQTFKAGAPLVYSSGALAEATSPAPVSGFAGIAAEDATGITGTATTGAVRSFIEAADDQEFITKNYFSAGSLATPPGSLVGGRKQITKVSGAWGVDATDATAGTDLIAEVTQVLDSKGNPVSASDSTNGVYVVFRIVRS